MQESEEKRIDTFLAIKYLRHLTINLHKKQRKVSIRTIGDAQKFCKDV